MSRLEGMFGRDLELSGLAPRGAASERPRRSVTRGGTLEDALPGEAGLEPWPLSMEDEDWIQSGYSIIIPDIVYLTWMQWWRCGGTEQLVLPEVEMGEGVEASLPVSTSSLLYHHHHHHNHPCLSSIPGKDGAAEFWHWDSITYVGNFLIR